jgi:hypothetical protein
MGVGIYYFYYGYGLKAFEGRHIRIKISTKSAVSDFEFVESYLLDFPYQYRDICLSYMLMI